VTTLNRKNTFLPLLLVFSAGLLLRAHSAFANDSSNDAEAQAKAFLDPPVVHHVIAVQGIANSLGDDRTLGYQDAQESVRAFLSGKSITDSAERPATARSTQEERPAAGSGRNYRASSDAQEAMRRTILGLGAAPPVASSNAAARETLSVGSKRVHLRTY
jgi:hypothetical protein